MSPTLGLTSPAPDNVPGAQIEVDSTDVDKMDTSAAAELLNSFARQSQSDTSTKDGASLQEAQESSSSSVSAKTSGLPNPLPPGYNKDQPICANCSTQTTPLWRRSHDSTSILCNACALFFKMKGRPRPISLKTDVIKSRNRAKGKPSSSKDRTSLSAKRNENISRKEEAPKRRTKKESSPILSTATTPNHTDDVEMDGEEDELDSESDGHDKSTPRAQIPPVHQSPPTHTVHPYPHPPHPHAHAPYPSPRSRSRSSSSTRRAPSVDRSVRGTGSHSNEPFGFPGYSYPFAPYPNPYYPIPTAIYPGYPPPPHLLPAGYTTPLSSSHGSSHGLDKDGEIHPAAATSELPNGRVVLAPLGHQPHAPRSGGSTPNAADPGSVSPPQHHIPIPRSQNRAHLSNPLFEAANVAAVEAGVRPISRPEEVRRNSTSSNSPTPSGGSSDGVRSPEVNPRGNCHQMSDWNGDNNDDERRGRSQTRHVEDQRIPITFAHREFYQFDEHEEDGLTSDVQQSMGELRVVDPARSVSRDSRSQSSGTRSATSKGSGPWDLERGRPPPSRGQSLKGRGSSLARSTDNSSRPRGDGTGIRSSSQVSNSRNTCLPGADAEISRLKTRVAELSFLNNLMQNRLAQLEGPGKVPLHPMSMNQEAELMEEENGDEVMQEDETNPQSLGDDELKRLEVAAKDPEMRAKLLLLLQNEQAQTT